MAAPKEFITLDELKQDRLDLFAEYQTRIERLRKMLWYRCPPGSVDKEGFPAADTKRVQEFAALVLEETGKNVRVPRLPPYQDGASFL